MSEPRDTRAPGRSTAVARHRAGETAEQRARRQRWGRLDELAIDFINDTEDTTVAKTHQAYRSRLNSLVLPVVGDRWVVDCDHDALAVVLEHARARGDTRVEAALSVIGSLVNWATAPDVHRWPPDVPAFGGPDTRRGQRRADRRLRAQDSRTELIKVSDCPTVEQTWAYAEAVRWEAVRMWGPAAAHLGDLPKVQYVTGARIGELVALNGNDYDPDAHTWWIEWQYDREASWEYGQPMPLAPTKNAYPRYAHVWEWAGEEFLDKVAHGAVRDRDGVLFAPPTREHRSWIDTLETLLRAVARATGYGFTPHWHRHAYASLNLAPVADGGYDRGVPRVADWLGDTPASVVKTYWHSTGDAAHGWSARRPNRRRAS